MIHQGKLIKMEGVILMDKIKLEKLRNKITKEFNIKFFNGEINFISLSRTPVTLVMG